MRLKNLSHASSTYWITLPTLYSATVLVTLVFQVCQARYQVMNLQA